MGEKSDTFRTTVLLLCLFINIFSIHPINPDPILENSRSPLKSAVSDWWDENYLYRRIIIIQNFNDYEIEEKYTFSFNINTKWQIDEGKMQSSGSDFRIVWINPISKDIIEIDRINLTEFNQKNTNIAFKIQDSIPAQTEISDYYIYYGNPNAKNPPSNYSNVYLIYDDFNEIIGPASNWEVRTGEEWRIDDNKYQNSDTDIAISIFKDFVIRDVSIEVTLKSSSTKFGLGVISRWKNDEKMYYAGLGFSDWRTSYGLATDKDLISILSDGHSKSELNYENNYNLRFDCINTQILVYLDNSLIISSMDETHLKEGSIGLISYTSAISQFDDLKVSKMVEKMPDYLINEEEELSIEINNIIENSDPLELGMNYSVQIEINVPSRIKEALFKINQNSYNMTQVDTNLWKFSDYCPINTGYYSYEILMQDISERWYIFEENFSVIDTTAPTIKNVNAIKNPINLGENSIIEVETDDESLITDVFIEYENYNHSMIQISDNSWIYTSWKPISLGINNFKIYAIDILKNIASQTSTIETIDDSPPIISNVILSDENISYYQNQSFSADILDNGVGIDIVIISIDGNDFQMSNTVGSQYIYENWEATNLGLIDYTIKAIDQVGNENEFSGNFLVINVSKPIIENITFNQNPIENGETLEINVNIYDEKWEISDVFIEIFNDEFPMNKISENEYSFSINVNTNNTGVDSLSIKANNSQDVWTQNNFIIQIIDSKLPSLLQYAFKHNSIEYGDVQSLSIEAFDETGIEDIKLEYESINFTLNKDTINNYSISWKPINLGSEDIRLYIIDMAGNIFSTILEYNTVDTTTPILSNLIISKSDVEIGEDYYIQINASDLIGIQNVLIEFNNKNYSMNSISPEIWDIKNLYPNTIGLVYFNIYAQDNSGLWSSTSNSINFTDFTNPTVESFEEIVDPLELGNNLIIKFNALDNMGISKCLLIENNKSHTMKNPEANIWYFDEWIPKNVSTYNYSIEIIDLNNNKLIIYENLTVEDTIIPAPPIFVNSPSGELSGSIIFDWADGLDASGINYYHLIIDNESNIYSQPGYVYEEIIYNIGSNSSFFELKLDLAAGNYYYFLFQVDNANHESSAAMGSFQIKPSEIIDGEDKYPNDSLDENGDDSNSPSNKWIYYFSTMIVMASLSIVTYSKKKYSKNNSFTTASDIANKDPEYSYKIIELNSILEHLNKINFINLLLEESKNEEMVVNTKIFAKKQSHNLYYSDIETIQLNIKEADKLFDEGAYIQAIGQYEQISEHYSKIGEINASFLYSEKAKKIMSISHKRDLYIEEYEEANTSEEENIEPYNKIVHQILKIQSIIELSLQIKDKYTIQEFKEILDELQKKIDN